MSNSRRAMTLNLTDPEMEALSLLSNEKDMTKTAIIRQAIRLYQLIDCRVKEGKKLFFEDDITKEKTEMMLL